MAKRKKKERPWVGYYCKVSEFEMSGDENGARLELELELLEPVPKVTSVTLSVYAEKPEVKIEDQWIPGQGKEQRLVPSEPDPRSFAWRRPDGSVNIATWWSREGVMALIHVLLSERPVYVSFNAREFY